MNHRGGGSEKPLGVPTGPVLSQMWAVSSYRLCGTSWRQLPPCVNTELSRQSHVLHAASGKYTIRDRIILMENWLLFEKER